MVKARLTINDSYQKLLLTRSPHLAEKLRRYTGSLLESQPSLKSLTGSLAGGRKLLVADDELQETDTILAVRNHHLPLICTFDWFLGLLENTVRLRHHLISLQEILSNRLE